MRFGNVQGWLPGPIGLNGLRVYRWNWARVKRNRGLAPPYDVCAKHALQLSSVTGELFLSRPLTRRVGPVSFACMNLEPVEDPFTPLLDKCDFMIAKGFMTTARRDELLAQVSILENAMAQLTQDHPGEFVAVANGKFYFADSVEAVEDEVMTQQPSHMFALAGISPAKYRFDIPASGG